MAILVVVGVIAVVAVSLFVLVLSLCVIASRADRDMEEIHMNDRNEHSIGEHER